MEYSPEQLEEITRYMMAYGELLHCINRVNSLNATKCYVHTSAEHEGLNDLISRAKQDVELYTDAFRTRVPKEIRAKFEPLLSRL